MLEGHCLGTLMGLPLGPDICYASQLEVDRRDMDTRLTIPGVAGTTSHIG
jgi:ethanolamine ammonia-lyase large subunit